MVDKAIYSACSNKFFPSVINLIGSIKTNYPAHPQIFIYDLGLSWNFRRELRSIRNVELLPMPKFCAFWRACYTWKTYIFQHPQARLNFYMDAGCQVLRPLDEVFNFIEKDDYFCVEQYAPLSEIAPAEFKYLFPVREECLGQNTMTAGIFGFKKNSTISCIIDEVYEAGLAGMCLGYSKGEPWKNRGANKTSIVRGCRIFRFDTSVFNLILRKNLGNFIMHSLEKYGGHLTPYDHPEQLIWNFRMNYSALEYLPSKILHKNFSATAVFNRFWISAFLAVKNLRALAGKVF